MEQKNVSQKDALQMAMTVIGVAKIGYFPSEANVVAASAAMAQLNFGDGQPMFPRAVKSLKELQGNLLPSHELCGLACKEMFPEFKRIKQSEREAIRGQVTQLTERQSGG